MTVAAFEDSLTDVERIVRRRYLEARTAGLSMDDANDFSTSDSDVRVLRLLVKHGASPEQMVRVL